MPIVDGSLRRAVQTPQGGEWAFRMTGYIAWCRRIEGELKREERMIRKKTIEKEKKKEKARER